MEQTIFAKAKWQLILFLARRLPDCKTITPTLSQSLDRELTFRERIVTRLHLFTCEACARYLEHIRILNNFIHRYEPGFDGAASSLNESAKARMKAALASFNR